MAMSEEVKAKLRQHSAAKRKRERKMVDVTPGEVLCQIDWLEEAGRFKCYDPDKSMAASWFRYTPRAVIDAARTRMAHRWGVVARKDGHRVVPVFHYADLTTLLDRLQLDPKVRYYGTGRAYHATVYTNYHGQRRPDGTARPPLSVTAYWGKSWDKSRDMRQPPCGTIARTGSSAATAVAAQHNSRWRSFWTPPSPKALPSPTTKRSRRKWSQGCPLTATGM
jgi:hypothetical protein